MPEPVYWTSRDSTLFRFLANLNSAIRSLRNCKVSCLSEAGERTKAFRWTSCIQLPMSTGLGPILPHTVQTIVGVLLFDPVLRAFG